MAADLHSELMRQQNFKSIFLSGTGSHQDQAKVSLSFRHASSGFRLFGLSALDCNRET